MHKEEFCGMLELGINPMLITLMLSEIDGNTVILQALS